MDYELEVHPVGDASRAGDAISVRYWATDHYEIIVVDGGTDASGEALVEHITTHYGADAYIHHVVSTHPDTDHACGLRAVLSTFSVGTLWLHGVWHHADEMLPFFQNKRWSVDGLSNAIRERYPVIEELLKLADERNTPVREPFAGVQIGPFTVLSPTRYAYLRLVPQFRKTPDADVDALRSAQMYIEPKGEPSWLAAALSTAASWVAEHWDMELLREDPVTAAENESSTVLFAAFGTERVLLTADAGINALTWAANTAEELGLNIIAPTLIQVPHHGSRSNVSPTILDRLLGARLPLGGLDRGVTVVSSPKDDTKHPRNMVINAFRRRGYPVYKTQGIYFRRYTPGMPQRFSEVAAIPFDWFYEVEGYD